MKCSRGGRIALLLLFAVLLVPFLTPLARAQGPRVLVAEVADAIERSTLEYVSEAVAEAQAGGYAALVVRFDTPGGALAETEAIAGLFVRATTLPILGFVGPVGAHAWSAGTILLESTDLAAMAPGTTIGSVQPVIVGPTGTEPVTDPKIVNAVVLSLEEKLRLHGRATALAQRFVVENLNLNATDALRLGATEIVASSVADFLAQADGRVTVYKGLFLNLAGAEIVPFQPSLRVSFLTILSDPLVASLLLILGIYAIAAGIGAPGHGAEIAGIILVLLALIGLGFSIDPIALLLIVIGVILLIVELKTPGFGAFGVGGIIAIVLGAVFLAPLRPPTYIIAPAYQLYVLLAILIPTASVGGFLLFALYKVMKLRRAKPVIGAMVGERVVAAESIRAGERGYVQYNGELWQAIPDGDLGAGEDAFIHSEEGLLLYVSRRPLVMPLTSAMGTRLWRALRRWLLGERVPRVHTRK